MSYNIFPTDGDTITESDWTAILDRANARDYVERGLTVTLNGDGTFDVGAGLAFIRDSGNNQTYPVEDESGTTGVQLADTSTTNYIYLTFDPSASDVEGSVEYHVDTDQTPPAGQPSLLISEADESTSTVKPRNQEPSLSADQADVADTATDPSADGELRRNGSDVKIHSGGAVQNLSDVGGGGLTTTTIDDTNSPYLTQDEDVIYCDTSSGAVTVQLASADATLANEIRVVNIDATNAVTVETEGSETIDPNAEASKTIANAGWAVAFVSDSSDWDTTLAGEFESVTTDQVQVTNETFIRGTRSSDSSSTASGTYINMFDGESKDVRGEFNGSAQFVPDESGEYQITAVVQIDGTAGDQIRCRVQDVGTNTLVVRLDAPLQEGLANPFVATTVQLSAGTTYEVQISDLDSSFIVKGGETKGEIIRSVVA